MRASDPRLERVAARLRLGVAALLLAVPTGARGQAALLEGMGGPLGFGSACLGPNDDGASGAIDLSPAFPDGLDFFGSVHRSLHVNTNGSVSFGGPVPQYTPSSFPAATWPLIAPYWADVDLRVDADEDGRCDGPAGVLDPVPACHEPSSNGVWWHLEPGRLVVTWHEVGYYDCRTDKRMSFQLVLSRPESCVSPGDFDVEFRYARCEWTTGERSGGVDGLGGVEAQAGFDAGDGEHFVEIPGSRDPLIHEKLCTQSNVGLAGVWRFAVRSGEIACADAGRPCETAGQGVCALGRTVCVGGRTECSPLFEPGEERCNGLDDDCDGLVDESPEAGGTPLCGAEEVCDRGRCVGRCGEFGCAPGYVCVDGVSCVEEACRDVRCGATERCLLGVCVSPCAGVRCPLGQVCRVGRCMDPCEGVDCGACGVCEQGRCVERCRPGWCPGELVCADDGQCVEAACRAASCPEGSVCGESGRCVDRCEGAVCPRGERCRAGRCEPLPPEPDAGTDAGADAGADAGRPPPPDASTMEEGGSGRPDGASSGRGPSSAGSGGCGCRLRGEAPLGGWASLLVLFGLLRSCRRRRG